MSCATRSGRATSSSRYGGEEFAITFPDCSAVEATRALNTLREKLDAAITVGGLPKFTVSFGITEAEPGEELDAVLRRADDALMKAKREGRDRVVLHDAVRGASPVSSDGRADLIPLLDEDYFPQNNWFDARTASGPTPEGALLVPHVTHRRSGAPLATGNRTEMSASVVCPECIVTATGLDASLSWVATT